MKRIAIFCDGTWNKMSAEHPTNVLLAAQGILSAGADGVAQVVYYDEGVGTSFLINERLETRLAGAFGWGLFDKIEAAYRFLIFNFEPGDEIFIFGFSRGAYTARSLAGLIRKCGIIPKADSRNIKAAFDFYKDGATHPDSDAAQKFRMIHSPQVVLKELDRDWRISNGGDPVAIMQIKPLVVKYLGVWDTVGALGVPRHLLISKLTNAAKKYEFHDLELSSTVHSARHAVAVDEDRLSFSPTLWSNIETLNAAQGDGTNYQQLWFPGDHGSVGGGGDIRGLSNGALIWILEGAEKQGLAVDGTLIESARKVVDPFAPLQNQSQKPSWTDRVYRRQPRLGPQQKSLLSPSTIARLARPGAAVTTLETKGWMAYRPQTLARLWPS